MKILFAGTPTFAAGFLDTLINSRHSIQAVITQPDKPGKRGRKLIPSPVKQLAIEKGLSVLQPSRLRVADIEHLAADLMVVVAFGQILKPALLEYPRLGCLNVHGSLLPRWRGAAPVQRAILGGDTESGITLIQMDAGLDTGAMLARSVVPISPGDTAGDLFEKLAQSGQSLLLQTLDQLEAGTLSPEPQDNEHAVYAHKIEKTEAMIDWQQDAVFVERLVRAFCPEPVAYSYLGDMRIRFHQGKIMPGGRGKPGEILDITRHGVLIQCLDSAYLAEKIQLPVGKGSLLSGSDIINGWTDFLQIGSFLGGLGNE